MKTILQKTMLMAMISAICGWGAINAQSLVKDIIPGTGSSNPAVFIKINDNTILLFADDGVNGQELWKTDGTEAGTALVKDINVGPNSSFIFNRPLIFNGKMFFNANDGVTGKRVWVSDGTDAGTMMLINASVSSFTQFAEINGLVIFAAGGSLYVSDGTPVGTNLLNPQNPSLTGVNPGGFIKSGNFVFYKAGSNGTELWRTDGTLGGTSKIMSNTGSNASNFSNCNDTLYLSASDGMSGEEPYKSDGTPAGTVMIKDIVSGPGGSITYQAEFTFVNGTVFFDAYTPATGSELWKTDGTSAGTSMVKDIKSGSGNSFPSYLYGFKNELYFSAMQGSGYKLWKSDGTASGTVMVNTNTGETQNYIVYHDSLFFSSGLLGNIKLWKSDGTIAGTVEVPGLSITSPTNFTIMGDELYFAARTSATGYEIWKYGIPSLGLSNLSGEDNFYISPNPSTGKFTLQMMNDELRMMNNEVKIYNILGEAIQHSIFSIQHSTFIDISNQPSGIYFVQIKDGDPEGLGTGKIYHQKIVKQ